jgi:hypothetical protein
VHTYIDIDICASDQAPHYFVHVPMVIACGGPPLEEQTNRPPATGIFCVSRSYLYYLIVYGCPAGKQRHSGACHKASLVCLVLYLTASLAWAPCWLVPLVRSRVLLLGCCWGGETLGWLSVIVHPCGQGSIETPPCPGVLGHRWVMVIGN